MNEKYPAVTTLTTSWYERAMVFLNSGFGLWFLSSVVLSGLTFGYGLLDNYLTVEKERSEKIRRLDVEIRSRTGQLEALMLGIQDHPDIERAAGLRRALTNLLRPPTSAIAPTTDEFAIYPAFPEFKERTLLSLLVELMYTVPESKQSEVESAFVWVFKLTPARIGKVSAEELGVEYKTAFDGTHWQLVK